MMHLRRSPACSSHARAAPVPPCLVRSVSKRLPTIRAASARLRMCVSVRAVNSDAFRPNAAPPVARPAAQQLAPPVKQHDFLVIGSGIAGLTYALKVAEHGTVAIITKDNANEGCTRYAQGGVCAVLDKSDSVTDHVRDTVVAGAFLNDLQAVEVVCREGPARVLELVELGAEFSRNPDGTLHLTKEGGHSNRRIVHAADLTGAEIERALLANARGHKNITFYEHHMVVDLVVDEYGGALHCFGADVLDQRANTMTRFLGLATMLASGGAGQVYPNTTNPHVATGDGIAMAYRAHANVSNMEFVQFHPTGLYNPSGTGSAFLISEAVRGEGGILFNMRGERFMEQYDERLELAPRDIVARSIHDQMLRHGNPHVLLDISHKPRHDVLHHFPNIAAKCMELGIDITQDPIPVLPVQHYTCGGVNTGLLGETNVQGLYACGEVACSGLHGANRLASNSLLEGLVFAERAVNPSVAHAEHAQRSCSRQLHYAAASADFRGPRGARELNSALAEWVATRRQELRDIMWRCCGIVRRSKELMAARDYVVSLYIEAKAIYKNYGVNTQLVELLNMATVAELMISCALQRKESRGLHFSADYPFMDESQRRPSLINTSFKSRYDLSPYMRNVPSVLPAGTGGPASAAQPKRVARKQVQRDRELAVRSTPQDL
ncbi:L-aspartate oxidase [Volvox carteri f. nagariensis]|uniref:L-aspartate oxidase n=1 Tax=Volvox carteri f. nagariensis TaxID=3068 RepID=D8U4B9_VOLCA|nr:L-aspartate oxidase [Volvox carteri f. nagariensis]EFJ45376.1 L-aspartate oxidase [Volvox carteri f. nagariensis]|eukprot:XP_002953403.1 L-aspartate oxidase [Volvox carteri f. nagariensis]